MANIRKIKTRIKSAKNIAKITKAMELVAASKMRKAQQQALAGKLYAQKIYEMVMTLSSQVEYTDHPLLKRPEKMTGKKLVFVIATNKGLCGGLNSNMFRYLLKNYTDNTYEYVTMGSKAVSFLTRVGRPIAADFSESVPFSHNVSALNDFITSEFIS